MKKLQLGLNHDISNAEYHADKDWLSSSVLKKILKDIGAYYEEYILGKAPPPFGNQNALDEGSLAHSMILEPHLIDKEYAFYDGSMKSGAVFETFKASKAPHLKIISRPQKLRVQKLIEAYRKHPKAPDLMKNVQVEHTLCVELNGVPVKVRFDAVDVEAGAIYDVKTTGYSGELDDFKMTCDNLSYGLSGALYCMAAEAFYGKKFDFYFIVLSKKDETCDVYRLGKERFEAGVRDVLTALKKYKQAKETGIWSEVDDASVAPQSAGDYEILDV